jgi:uncharacterized protein (TIGR03066 family)
MCGGKNMKRRFRILPLVLLVVFSFMLTACGSQNKTQTIVGKWKSSDGKESVYEFREDKSGTMTLNGTVSKDFTYTVEGDKLKITTEVLKQKQENECTYTLEDGKLTIKDNLGSVTYNKES